MRHRTVVISFAVALLLTGLTGVAAGSGGSRSQRLNLRQIRVLGPAVWNYDLEVECVRVNHPPPPHCVEHPEELLKRNPKPKEASDPVMIVFTVNATQENVTDILRSIGLQSGPRKGEEYRSAWGYATVEGERKVLRSKGLKTDPCYRPFMVRGTPFDFHVRFYGGFSTRHYGRVMLGAAHEDRNDCTSNPDQVGQSYGWNEDAEKYVAGRLRAKGCVVHPDALDFQNRLDFWKPPHRYLSDGKATVVEVRGVTCRTVHGKQKRRSRKP